MSSLKPFEGPLGQRKAKHLIRRLTFKYNKELIDFFSKKSALESLNELIKQKEDSLSEPYDPLPTVSPDGYWTSSELHPNQFDGQGRKRSYITGHWWYNAINQSSLRHKFTFFLHSCFTVGKDLGAGPATTFYDHLRLLDYYSLGNIKTLAKKITLDNSMLTYLDNTDNNANNPNENYGREYLELFTILKGEQKGEGDYTNYTEFDVQQASKVFSGFKTKIDRSNIDLDTGIPRGYANKNKHDKNDKTFSAAFDNKTIKGRDSVQGMYEELDEFVEMVFSKEATAISYARKLYRFFVKSEWDEEVETNIIKPLAIVLKENNYELIPAIKTLFASEHFYDMDDSDTTNEIIGAIVKSPLQLLSEISTLFNVSFPNPEVNPLYFYRNFYHWFVHNIFLSSAGLQLYNPDSVAGYPAHYQTPDFDRHWFSSTTIISRYKLMESFILGKNTIISGNIYSELDTVSFIENNIINISNSIEMITEISSILYPEVIDESRVSYFESILISGYNSYYWGAEWRRFKNNGNDEVIRPRLNELLIAMVNAPEFQLM
ncbi:DUF1800 family protein [Urechidicola vernalis]|uniref:DUF1800 family protein n=1 Tax=Urechidicola vernalis TaxID=3075600 RepID=A0ABU2Y6B1_9FLAO|nr:DUF1800 family protein [Urechidicola sp. P050]MDT0553747.1 DUF1800 family protein [Urechidicola sp. P050]